MAVATVKVQTGGDGTGRDEAGHPTRARRPAKRRSRRAATAAVGTGRGCRPGTAPHGARVQAGSDDGGGEPAGRSSAAPRGAKVKTSGDGKGKGGAQASPERSASRGQGSSRRRGREGAGAAFTGPARYVAPTGRGGAPAKAGGGPARAPPTRGPYSCMPGSRRGTGAGGGALRTSAAPRLHLPASSSPRGPHHPLAGYPEWPNEASRENKSGIPPPLPPLPGSGPCFATLRAARTPDHRPDQSDSGRQGPVPGRDARPGITGVLSRCAGRPTPPSPYVFTQVGEGGWFQRRPAPDARGGAGAAIPPLCPPRPLPPRSAAPDRPAGPPLALAASLNRHPVRPDTRATTCTRPLPAPSPPVLTFAPRDAAPDRPAGPPPPPSPPV